MLEIATRFVLVHSSHDVGATCHADRRRVVVAIEYHALFCQLIHVWGLDTGRTVAAH